MLSCRHNSAFPNGVQQREIWPVKDAVKGRKESITLSTERGELLLNSGDPDRQP